MARPIRLLLLLVSCLVVACDSGAEAPTADELAGLWVNVDDGTVRAFEFGAVARTYDLYVYADGTSPVVNQSGSYEVASGRLVTNVNSSVDPAVRGQSFANDFLGFTGGTFTLSSETASGGKRLFTRSDALP